MIKIFRTIRQKLLKQNQFNKYLIYAVGEIALVMIGILLALQVNNWNQQLDIKETEKDYLNNLRTEFNVNLENLELIHKNRQKARGNIERLMELSGTVPKEVDDLEISNLLSSVYDYMSVVFMATTPVLEEIKNSGHLVTITNAELRNQFIIWEQVKDPLVGTQNTYKNHRDDFLNIVVELGSIKNVGHSAMEFPETKGLNFDDTNKLVLENRAAGNLLRLMQMELHLFEKIVYPSVKAHIEQTIKLIDADLK